MQVNSSRVPKLGQCLAKKFGSGSINPSLEENSPQFLQLRRRLSSGSIIKIQSENFEQGKILSSGVGMAVAEAGVKQRGAE